MSDLSRARLLRSEIVEKLEWSLNEYEKHMKLHKMKTNLGTFKAVITVAAGLIEDLVKFKWGKAAELLFTLRDRKIGLMEAELRAPGKELAYIVSARERFP